MFFVLPFVFFKNSFAGYRIWGCCCFSFIWFILNKSLYRHCCLLTCIFSNAESASVISSLCIESVTFSLAAYKISSSFLGFHQFALSVHKHSFLCICLEFAAFLESVHLCFSPNLYIVLGRPSDKKPHNANLTHGAPIFPRHDFSSISACFCQLSSHSYIFVLFGSRFYNCYLKESSSNQATLPSPNVGTLTLFQHFFFAINNKTHIFPHNHTFLYYSTFNVVFHSTPWT